MSVTITATRRALHLVVALLACTLAACTGTFEDGAPIVLLVATGTDGAGGDAAIVGFLVEPPGPASPRSVTPLGTGDLAGDLDLPVRDWDWRDRAGVVGGPGAGRTQLTVLASVSAAALDARQARLHRYDVSAFETSTPTLTQLGAPLDLVVDGAWNADAIPVEDGFEPDDGVCLSALSVSGDGRYAALLDRRSDCQAGDAEVYLYVVDLEDARLVWASTPDDVAPTRAYIDQGADTIDILIRRGQSRFDVYRSELEALQGPLGGTERFGEIEESQPLRDIAGAGDERWLLFDGWLRTLSDTGALGPRVASASGATRRLVPTDARLPTVVIGGNDLWVHATPTSEGLTFARRYLDGVTDVADRLTYLVRPGAIDTLDLLVFTPERPIGESVSTLYSDGDGGGRLAAPRLVTWFRPPLPPLP